MFVTGMIFLVDLKRIFPKMIGSRFRVQGSEFKG
jgi:hypothetical protein